MPVFPKQTLPSCTSDMRITCSVRFNIFYLIILALEIKIKIVYAFIKCDICHILSLSEITALCSAVMSNCVNNI